MSHELLPDGRRLLYVCSCHMDREWYIPFEEMRVFFGRILNRVLELLKENEQYCFMVDGQTAVMEDFLQVFPEHRETVRRYVEEGRLLVGPWLIQPDEVIPFGESMIRNLLFGLEESRRLGAEPMPVGYLPDSFGHVAQMPQILNGFGIDTVFAMRSVLAEHGREIRWRSPDGSEVLTYSCGYGMASAMDPKNMRNGIHMAKNTEEFERSISGAFNDEGISPQVLVTVCGDMQPPADPAALELSHCDRLTDCFGILRDYADKLPVVEGELRGDDIANLEDTLAERIYVKTENTRVQGLLAGLAEPLALVTYGTDSKDYPNNFLRRAWHLLVENHTHDGICACSSDDTCEDLMSRFRACTNICDRVTAFTAQDLLKSVDTSWVGKDEHALLVFNPHGRAYSGPVAFTASVYEETAAPHYEAVDADGNRYAVTITDTRYTGVIKSDADAQQCFSENAVMSGYLQVRDVPAMGYCVYRLQPAEKPAVGLMTGPDSAENALVSIQLHTDGTITLKDKRSGKEWTNLGYLHDSGNRGDAYSFKAMPNDRPLDSRNLTWTVEAVSDAPAACQFLMSTVWKLPAAMTDDSMDRVTETVSVPIRTLVTLHADSSRVDIRTEIDNMANDHIITAQFPTGDVGVVISDSPFSTERRPDDGKVYPSSTYVRQGDLALLHRGLHRYSAKEGVVSLTLLLTSAVLYREFFRRYNDEFMGGQLHRTLCLEYALMPLTDDDDVQTAADAYCMPLTAFLTDRHEGDRPAAWSMLHTDGLELCAVKRAEDGNGWIVRLCNRTDNAIDGSITLAEPAAVSRVNLNETPLDTEAVTAKTVPITAKPHEIVTLRIV